MAKYVIAAVKDELAGENGTFFKPAIEKDLIYIERAFEYSVNHEAIMKDNASDFSLYKIGYFDDETGQIEPMYQKLVTGTTVLRRDQ